MIGNKLIRASASGCALAMALAVAGCGSATAVANHSSTASPLTVYGGVGNTIQADFNPFQVNTFQATSGTDLLYLPLETYNSVTGKYVPHLATGYALPSAEKIVFTLRSGVEWSNGTAVTAADVVSTFMMLKQHPALDVSGVWQTLASVSATGHTVTFDLKVRDTPIVQALAAVPIVPRSVWSKVSDPVTFTNASPTVIDGPYGLESASTVKVTFVKNPKYYAAAAMSDSPATVVGLPVTGGSGQVLAMEHGTFDWNSTNDSDRGGFKTDYVAKDPTHNHYWLAPSGLVTLFMNLTKAPFNDSAFRQALSVGINRAELGQQANVNGYEPGAPQTGVLPTSDDLVPSSIPDHGKITADPAKARQILTSHGYKYVGGKLIGPNGHQVSFTLNTTQGFVDWLGIANGLVSQLSALGITVTVDQLQPNSATDALFSGQYQAAIYATAAAYNGGGTPYEGLYSALDSDLTTPVGMPAAGDYERLKDPTVDALLQQAAASTDTAKQNAALGKVVQYVYNQAPVIELAVEPGWYEYSTQHYTGWPTAADPYASPFSTWSGLDVIPNLKASHG